MHASEAVRLSVKRCAFCLAALADACYLHAQAQVQAPPSQQTLQQPQARLLFGLPLEGYAAATRTAAEHQARLQGPLPAAGGRGAPLPHLSSAAAAEDEGGRSAALVRSDAALHSLAAHCLRALSAERRALPSGSPADAAAVASAGSVAAPLGACFPALAVEAGLLGASALAVVERQAAELATLVEAAAAAEASGDGAD